MRTVICHYHIFKNSGTSFDTLLENSFGDKHVSFDGPFPYMTVEQDQLEHIARRNNEAVSFASHQIRLPVPVSLDIHFLAAVFIRHPLLRAQSIYRFKQKTNDGTELSDYAQNVSFNDWLLKCFDSQSQITHVSNPQTRFLGGTYKQKSLKRRSKNTMTYDLNQAMRNLESVPLLARTEYFDRDVARFESITDQHGLKLKFTKGIMKNTTTSNHTLPVDQRVDAIMAELDDEVQEMLLAANQQDLVLYNFVNNKLDRG